MKSSEHRHFMACECQAIDRDGMARHHLQVSGKCGTPLSTLLMETDYQLIYWLCMTLYMSVYTHKYIGQMPVSRTVPNPEVLQATINWLHPVCIYGCFALLGLISAVHSRITQCLMPRFLCHGLCIVPIPDKAYDRWNTLLSDWHVGSSKEESVQFQMPDPLTADLSHFWPTHSASAHTRKHNTHTPTAQHTHKSIYKHVQKAGTITYIKFADACGYWRLRSCSFDQPRVSSGHNIVQTILKRNCVC